MIFAALTVATLVLGGASMGPVLPADGATLDPEPTPAVTETEAPESPEEGSPAPEPSDTADEQTPEPSETAEETDAPETDSNSGDDEVPPLEQSEPTEQPRAFAPQQTRALPNIQYPYVGTCQPGVFYSSRNDGMLTRVDAYGQKSIQLRANSDDSYIQVNGVGIDSSTGYVYAFQRENGISADGIESGNRVRMYQYSTYRTPNYYDIPTYMQQLPVNGGYDWFNTGINRDLIAGAVDPIKHEYYFGGYNQTHTSREEAYIAYEQVFSHYEWEYGNYYENGYWYEGWHWEPKFVTQPVERTRTVYKYFLEFVVFKYDGNTIREVGRVDILESDSPIAGDAANGDIEFDDNGNLYVLFAGRPDEQGYSEFSAATIPASELARFNGTSMQLRSSSTEKEKANTYGPVINGLAFGADGTAIVGTTTAAYRYDPGTWQPVIGSNGTNTVTSNLNLPGYGTAGYDTLISTDLTSCSTPPTLALQKRLPSTDLPGGRANANDQFELEIADGSNTFARVTTTGDASGVQPDQIYPTVVRQGRTYTLREKLTETSRSQLDYYDTSYTCTAKYPNGSTQQMTPTRVSHRV